MSKGGLPYNGKKEVNELITVITSTYNREKYLPIAIESVLNQTYRNFEYHIVDDGSTDETRKVIEPFLKDSRVHYYFQENRGQSSGRNVGLKMAKGNFICFLDSDDVWELDKLETQLNIFINNADIDVVYGDIQHIDEKGNIITGMSKMKRFSGFITKRLVIENFVSFNTVMFRRICYENLGGLDENLLYSDDYDLWLRYSTSFKFHYYPKIFSNYRIHSDTISQNKDARFEAGYDILTRFFEKYPEAVGEGTKKKSWAHYYTRKGRYLVSKSEYMGALINYSKALKYYPACTATWKALVKMALIQR